MSEQIDTAKYKNKGFKRVVLAFFYSMEGIGTTLKHEAAFRQEFILCALLIPLSFFLPVSPFEQVVLIASLLLVLITELLNSALEAAVDDISMAKRALAKRAKDMGSAAVFFSLLNAALCWIVILVANWSAVAERFH